jgi:hypothetical protein
MTAAVPADAGRDEDGPAGRAELRLVGTPAEPADDDQLGEHIVLGYN